MKKLFQTFSTFLNITQKVFFVYFSLNSSISKASASFFISSIISKFSFSKIFSGLFCSKISFLRIYKIPKISEEMIVKKVKNGQFCFRKLFAEFDWEMVAGWFWGAKFGWVVARAEFRDFESRSSFKNSKLFCEISNSFSASD